jgi:hypothetical protein
MAGFLLGLVDWHMTAEPSGNVHFSTLSDRDLSIAIIGATRERRANERPFPMQPKSPA